MDLEACQRHVEPACHRRSSQGSGLGGYSLRAEHGGKNHPRCLLVSVTTLSVISPVLQWSIPLLCLVSQIAPNSNALPSSRHTPYHLPPGHIHQSTLDFLLYLVHFPGVYTQGGNITMFSVTITQSFFPNPLVQSISTSVLLFLPPNI